MLVPEIWEAYEQRNLTLARRLRARYQRSGRGHRARCYFGEKTHRKASKWIAEMWKTKTLAGGTGATACDREGLRRERGEGASARERPPGARRRTATASGEGRGPRAPASPLGQQAKGSPAVGHSSRGGADATEPGGTPRRPVFFVFAYYYWYCYYYYHYCYHHHYYSLYKTFFLSGRGEKKKERSSKRENRTTKRNWKGTSHREHSGEAVGNSSWGPDLSDSREESTKPTMWNHVLPDARNTLGSGRRNGKAREEARRCTKDCKNYSFRAGSQRSPHWTGIDP